MFKKVLFVVLCVFSGLSFANTPSQSASELREIMEYHFGKKRNGDAVMFNSIDKEWVERSIEHFKNAMKDSSYHASAKRDLSVVLGMFINKELDMAIAFNNARPDSRRHKESIALYLEALPCFIADMDEKLQKADKLGLDGKFKSIADYASEGIVALKRYAQSNALGECASVADATETMEAVYAKFDEEKHRKSKGLSIGGIKLW